MDAVDADHGCEFRGAFDSCAGFWGRVQKQEEERLTSGCVLSEAPPPADRPQVLLQGSTKTRRLEEKLILFILQCTLPVHTHTHTHRSESVCVRAEKKKHSAEKHPSLRRLRRLLTQHFHNTSASTAGAAS